MLSIKKLLIKYGSREILRDFSAEFPSGAITVIKGESGSGKSSLLNVLGLLQSAEFGDYTYNGRDLKALSASEKSDFRLRTVGFVFQDASLIAELPTIDNVAAPLVAAGVSPQEAGEKALKLLEFVGLSAVANSRPDTLSGGEQQRAAVARAIANNAEIILADEPTASLDKVNSEAVMDLLKKLAREQGKTVVIVSHDGFVESFADKLIEIADGQAEVRIDLREAADTKEATPQTQTKRKPVRLARYYNKKRGADKILARVFCFVTALVSACAVLSVSFGKRFEQEQRAFMDSISDNGIFLVRDDAMPGWSDRATNIAYHMSEKDLADIASFPGVSKVLPYYYLGSYGPSIKSLDMIYGDGRSNNIDLYDENDPIFLSHIKLMRETAIEKDLPFPLKWRLDNTDHDNAFSIEPVFPGEKFAPLLEYGSIAEGEKDAYITLALARKLSDEPETLIGQTLSVDAYVPERMRTGVVGTYDETGEEILFFFGNISPEKVEGIECRIAGILSLSYETNRTYSTKNKILLPYEYVQEIIDANIATEDELFIDDTDFHDLLLEPPAYMIFADKFENVPAVTAAIKALSPSYAAINKAQDVAKIDDSLLATRRLMTTLTLVFIAVVVVLFGLLYYLKNRARKKEIGILKAVGLTSRDVVALDLYTSVKSAAAAFVLCAALALAASLILRYAAGSGMFVITPLSLLVGAAVSVLTIILAGLLPILAASRVDPVEAIRRVMK